MKNLLIFLLSIISFGALAQPGSISQSVIRSRVNDSTTVNGAHGSGYGDIYFNNQRAVPAWLFWDTTCSCYLKLGSGSGGSSTFVGLTDGPGTFSGNTLRYMRVNTGGTALEYRTAANVLSDIAGAPLASPTFTGTPAAPTAAVGTNTTQLATTAFARANALNLRTSEIYPPGVSYQADPVLTGGNSQEVFEFLNLGNQGNNTENRNLVPAGIVRGTGSVLLTRNMLWNNSTLRWETPFQQADAYGSQAVDAGGEACILHATPPGVNFSDVPHEILLASALGVNGIAGYTTGYVVQIKAPLFATYSSAAYNPTTTQNAWNPTTAAEPLVHLHSLEAKGSGAKLNEYARIEGNGTSAYGAMYFAKSRGTYASKTTVVVADVIGSIGGLAYDGSAEQRTAEMRFVARGTISSGNAGQSIDFLTGASNTASNTTRLRITQDGVINAIGISSRMEAPASFTTIPDYSGFAGFSPAVTTSTFAVQQAASTSTGGLAIYGLGTTSTASTAIPLLIQGVLGATAPTAPAIVFRGMKHSGTTSVADLAATEILVQFRNNAAANIVMEMLANGRTGFGVTTPTANIHIKAGTATASTAPLKFTSGALLTTAEAGAVEFLTDKFYGTITTGAARKELTLNDAALTSGTIPVATTNGRLTDSGFTSTNLVSSTYTPGLTNVTNVTASTAYVTGYFRIGNSVTVYGKIDINPTLAASTATEVGINLPIASNMTGEQDLGGTAVSDALASLTARIKGDATNDRASVVFKSISITNDSYSFEFSYQVK